MIKKIITKLFWILGFDIKITKKKAAISPAIPPLLEIEKIAENPLDSMLHLNLAVKYFENSNYYKAYAELKTARSLGLPEEIYIQKESIFKSRIPELTEMNHNQYFRFHTLKSEIHKHIKSTENPSILDIGGGSGELASFIPEIDYCLVEPKVNGINGLILPFEDDSFDLVVSCHVLEHIPVPDREKFLDSLLSKSKKGVILLNPIQIDETLPEERMQLFIDVTNANWAKEHLECSLPTVDSIREYSIKRNLKFNYTPNGTMTTSMALVFFDHLSKNLSREHYSKVNKFLNTKYTNILDSEKYPNAGLFFLEK